MVELIPAILAKDAAEAERKLRLVEGVADWVQIDAMDGVFVPNTSWYDAEVVRALESPLAMELHLMVNDPQAVMRAWAFVKNLKRVIWHIEIPTFHAGLIEYARSFGWEVGLALSPDTPVTAVEPYLSFIDEVLILGVQPGFSGQALILSTLKKAAEIRALDPRIKIGLDGGVTTDGLLSIVNLEVDRINLASAVFGTDNPRETLEKLVRLVTTR